MHAIKHLKQHIYQLENSLIELLVKVNGTDCEDDAVMKYYRLQTELKQAYKQLACHYDTLYNKKGGKDDSHQVKRN